MATGEVTKVPRKLSSWGSGAQDLPKTNCKTSSAPSLALSNKQEQSATGREARA